MLSAPPLGFCAIAAVTLCVLFASESAPATLKMEDDGTSEVMSSMTKCVGEQRRAAKCWIAATGAGEPAMAEAVVELLGGLGRRLEPGTGTVHPVAGTGSERCAERRGGRRA